MKNNICWPRIEEVKYIFLVYTKLLHYEALKFDFYLPGVTDTHLFNYLEPYFKENLMRT